MDSRLIRAREKSPHKRGDVPAILQFLGRLLVISPQAWDRLLREQKKAAQHSGFNIKKARDIELREPQPGNHTAMEPNFVHWRFYHNQYHTNVKFLSHQIYLKRTF